MSVCVRSLTMAAIACVALSACGGGDGDVSERFVNTDYSNLRIADSKDAPLVSASEQQMVDLLRNGVRLSLYSTGDVVAASPPGFSPTTVQVAGVDEADYTKYDGEHVYAVQRDGAADSLRYLLRVFATDPATAGIAELASVELNRSPYARPVLYLVGPDNGPAQSVAVLSSEPEVHIADTRPAAILPFAPIGTTVLRLYDVGNPALPTRRWTLELSGELRASRRIGSTLYVTTVFYPSLPTLILPSDTREQRVANERTIRAAGAPVLLPNYREDGGAERPLARPGDCFVAQDATQNDAYRSVVTIAAIDLAARRVSDVACLSTNVSGTYVSQDALYVGGYGPFVNNDTTLVLHKFALEEGRIRYDATGAVPGQLSWTNPSYYMDEHEGSLRVVTTRSGDVHRLSVLRSGARNKLETVATLPNAARPEPIGKPNERLYAARFVGDRAYLVTFRFTDPLYALDLSDALDPKIAGTLEIPGFSTYLQPLGSAGAELLLSVGQATGGNGLNNGIKVELFDVHDLAQPRSVGARTFGVRGSQTEVNADPHALTTLPIAGPGDHYRVGLPIIVFEPNGGNGVVPSSWSYSGLHLFEIAGGANPSLTFKGMIESARATPANPSPKYLDRSRAVLHDESVFAVQDEKVIGRLWSDVAP